MRRYLLIILAAIVFCNTQLTAQTDSRKRTAETVVADGLAQLPAKNHADYTRIMNELATTGEQGVIQIASQLTTPEKGNNSVFEYALSGLTDYITTPGKGEKYRNGLRKGLTTAIARCDYAPNKVFLMSLLTKCATPDDASTFIGYIEDKDLADGAIAAITAVQGMDSEVAEAVRNSKAPHVSLAKIIEARKLQNCEDLLTKWIVGADDMTLKAIYSAMAATGNEISLNVLAQKAGMVGYKPEATHSTDAYIAMLDRISDSAPETVKKAAKSLMASTFTATRCAGLRLWIKACRGKDSKIIIKALKDRDIQYRNTALECGIEFGGRDILTTVSDAFNRLTYDAKTDVMRWYGNNRAEECMNDIVKTIGKNNGDLYTAALQAASKTGGEKALDAIIAQMGKDTTGEAVKALFTFNGNIKNGIAEALDSKDRKVVLNALPVAASRHMSSMYDRIVKLTGSDDTLLRDAAYEALGGVATTANIAALCAMLDKADDKTAPKLQNALAKALRTESGDRQYELTFKAMKSSPSPSLYYPLLAQAGTGKAIETLLGEKNKEAEKALISVNNTEILPILIDMAKQKAKGEERDKILSRYLTLVNAAQMTPEEKYLLLCTGNETQPSAENLSVKYVRAIGRTGTLHALGYMRKYYDKPAYIDAVAENVKDIVARNSSFNGGKNVRVMLEIAKQAYKRQQIDNPDAGYAVDEINGIIEKTKEEGYTLSTEETKMGKRGFWTMKNRFENFNLSFDWKTKEPLVLTLRSMPILTIDNKKGVKLAGSDNWKPYKSIGDWNTADIKMTDDRIFVRINGHDMIINETINNPDAGKPAKYSGSIGFGAGNDSLIVRYTRICKLPGTPVYELSAEEKKQGYELLFDGRSLDKWQGNLNNYIPREGNIYVTANYGGSGNLYTKKKYSDFIFRFEFCFDKPGVNNGIGIRTNIGTDAAYDGMEIQVLDHDDPIYKGLQPYQQHGAVYGIIVPEHFVFGKTGTWYTEEIKAVGDHITVTVNGKLILDGNIRKACKGHNIAPDGSNTNPYTVDKKNHPGLFNKNGYLSFCGHGEGVKFRNVRILDLSKKKKPRR